MSDLTERAYRIAWERLCSANDPRIAAAWELVQAWEAQAQRALEHKAALEHRPWTESRHAALLCEAGTANDHAAALCRVLDGDSPGGAS